MPNLFISPMQNKNGVFMGTTWKVMHPKGVWTLIMLREIIVPLLKRIVY